MKKLSKHVILLILFLLIFTILIGCSNKQNSKNTFDIEQFANEMKCKNYKFELKDVGKDFLTTKRKRMIIGNEALDIYLYSNNKKMENEAKFIDSDGSGYSNGAKSI